MFYVKLYVHSLAINRSDSTKMHGATVRLIVLVLEFVRFRGPNFDPLEDNVI